MITGPKTRIKGFKKCTDQTTQAIEALLTEARIDELKWVKSRSAKHAGIWIDERNNELDDRIKQLESQLKNERSNK